MFSWKSLKKFVVINGLLSGISYAKYLACGLYNNVFVYCAAESLSNVALLKFFENINDSKPDIYGEKRIIPKEKYPGEFLAYSTCISVVKGATHYALIQYLDDTSFGLGSYASFILKSFAIEMLFDVGHYAFHRLLHENKFLYKNIHKVHHKFQNPSIYTTFYTHPLDIAMVYSLPLVLSVGIVGCSKYELQLLTTYLTYQEIGGHIGKVMYPTSSFAQFIWLPRMFNIELYTEDHDLHHSHFNFNYGKRFSVMDKIFGTYMRPPVFDELLENQTVTEDENDEEIIANKDKYLEIKLEKE